MTILLFFLLKSFSASESIHASKNLRLPKSHTAKPAIHALNIAISLDEISVDGQKVVDLEQGKTPGFRTLPPSAVNASEDPDVVKPLFEILKEKRGLAMRAEERNELLKFTGDCVVQADKDISYDLLYKVLYTAGQVGYVMLNFAALQFEE
jgi:biopolymer transport protein ExbD